MRSPDRGPTPPPGAARRPPRQAGRWRWLAGHQGRRRVRVRPARAPANDLCPRPRRDMGGL